MQRDNVSSQPVVRKNQNPVAADAPAKRVYVKRMPSVVIQDGTASAWALAKKIAARLVIKSATSGKKASGLGRGLFLWGASGTVQLFQHAEAPLFLGAFPFLV